MKKSASKNWIVPLCLSLALFFSTSCTKINKEEVAPSTNTPSVPHLVEMTHPLDGGLPARVYNIPATAYDATLSLPSGYVTDGSVDYTDYIQKAVNDNAVIKLPDFPILVNTSGIKVKSNKKLYFQKKSALKMLPTAASNYYVILLLDASNVQIFNANIIGDRNEHLSTSGEWGMGIYVSGSKDILIDHPNISNCWGDGIYLGKDSWNKESDNVTINHAYIDNNRRAGITITGGTNISITNSIIKNTNGPIVSSGISIEPNTSNIIDNISIENCQTVNNEKVGIRIVTVKSYTSTGTNNVRINVNNIKDVGSKYSLTLTLGSASESVAVKEGIINISNIIAQDYSIRTLDDYSNAKNVDFNVYFDNIISIKGGEVDADVTKFVDNLIKSKPYLHWKG